MGFFTRDDPDRRAFTEMGGTAAQTTEKRAAEGLAATQGREAAQMQLTDPFRKQQQFLAQQYQNQILGKGPSIAQAQLQQGLDATRAQAASLAASGGMNPALAQRMAMQQGQNAALQTNQQAAILRAQEQAAAMQGMGGLAQGARGQDIGIAQNNLQAQMQQAQMNDAMRQFYDQYNMNMPMQQWQAAMQYEALKAGQPSGLEQVGPILGGAATGLATGGASALFS